VDELEPVLRTIQDAFGVFLRPEVLALGGDDRLIRRALASGGWHRVRNGAYVFAEHWEQLGSEARHVVLARAVMRSLEPDVTASHHSSGLLNDLDMWDVDLSRAHVTRLDGGAGRTEHDVVHHEGLCLDHELVERAGVSCTRPVRGALESALLSGVERGLVTVDSGLRKKLFTPEDLAEQHTLMEPWPGSQHLHLVVRMADGRSDSAGETRTRYLCWAQKLPAPDLQFEVYDGSTLIGTCDFAWPKHGLLGEFDGRVKYGRLLKPGEDPGEVVFREKRREDALRRVTGWRMVRIVWSDLYHPERTAAYIRQLMAYAA